jgi:hypothetical protein
MFTPFIFDVCSVYIDSYGLRDRYGAAAYRYCTIRLQLVPSDYFSSNPAINEGSVKLQVEEETISRGS